MAHHIYTTNAFVIESVPSGEADGFLTMLTEDLGLLRASARGVRLEKSKLRYSLQELSRTKVSLVRGKEIWRITNARIEDALFVQYRNKKNVLTVIARTFVLIRRLVGEEEKNEELFNILSRAFEFLERELLKKDELKHFEIIVVLKILDNLGYMGHSADLLPFIKRDFSKNLLAELALHKTKALREINTSLRETQL